MQAKKKKIPDFLNEDDERKFWASHDSTVYVDWETATAEKLPKLKATLRTTQLLKSAVV